MENLRLPQDNNKPAIYCYLVISFCSQVTYQIRKSYMAGMRVCNLGLLIYMYYCPAVIPLCTNKTVFRQQSTQLL